MEAAGLAFSFASASRQTHQAFWRQNAGFLNGDQTDGDSEPDAETQSDVSEPEFWRLTHT